MSMPDYSEIIASNMEIYKEEELLALAIIQKNRHRSCEPFEWFGPDPEPNPPGARCGCSGCQARFAIATQVLDKQE